MVIGIVDFDGAVARFKKHDNRRGVKRFGVAVPVPDQISHENVVAHRQSHKRLIVVFRTAHGKGLRRKIHISNLYVKSEIRVFGFYLVEGLVGFFVPAGKLVVNLFRAFHGGDSLRVDLSVYRKSRVDLNGNICRHVGIILVGHDDKGILQSQRSVFKRKLRRRVKARAVVVLGSEHQSRRVEFFSRNVNRLFGSLLDGQRSQSFGNDGYFNLDGSLAVGYDHELVVNGQSGLAVRHVCRYVLLRTVSVNGFDGNAGGFKPLPLDVRKLRGFAHKNKLRDKLGVNLYAPSRGQLGFPFRICNGDYLFAYGQLVGHNHIRSHGHFLGFAVAVSNLEYASGNIKIVVHEINGPVRIFHDLYRNRGRVLAFARRKSKRKRQREQQNDQQKPCL